jgi:tryptophan synthase alpha subunit
MLTVFLLFYSNPAHSKNEKVKLLIASLVNAEIWKGSDIYASDIAAAGAVSMTVLDPISEFSLNSRPFTAQVSIGKISLAKVR